MIDAIILLATALLESVYMASSALDALFLLVMAVAVLLHMLVLNGCRRIQRKN